MQHPHQDRSQSDHPQPDGPSPDRLARAVRAFVLGARPVPREDATHVDIAERGDTRLDAIERDVQEMRTRVNALFFAVITAGVADLIARTVLR